MTSNITTNNLAVKRGLTPQLTRLKARLRRARITAWQIAEAAGVTDAYVWMILNGRRKSSKVMAVAQYLLAEKETK